MVKLAQAPGVLLEDGPGCITIPFLPLRIKAVGLEGTAEWLFLRIVEHKALFFHLIFQLGILAGNVFTLFECSCTKISRNDVTNVGGQGRPPLTIRYNIVAVPDMARHREILLNLIDLCTLNEREWIFLTIDDLGLQCRIELIEVDGSWRCT